MIVPTNYQVQDTHNLKVYAELLMKAIYQYECLFPATKLD